VNRSTATVSSKCDTLALSAGLCQDQMVSLYSVPPDLHNSTWSESNKAHPRAQAEILGRRRFRRSKDKDWF